MTAMKLQLRTKMILNLIYSKLGSEKLLIQKRIREQSVKYTI